MADSTDAEASTPDPLAAAEALQDALGHEFDDPSLLELACTHRSWCAEHGGDSNERLEFLGDSVLGLVVTELLFSGAPLLTEGDLAKARAEVVNMSSLADCARTIGLGDAMRLGRGEELSGGRDKESILADAMEAIFGAVHLDSSIAESTRVISGLLGSRCAEALARPGGNDHKTRLQERAAAIGQGPPRYVVTTSGPDHGRRFAATVTVGDAVGQGSGSSKKQAEQQAAEDVLGRLDGGVRGNNRENARHGREPEPASPVEGS